MGQFFNGVGDLVTADTCKAAFASVFFNKVFWASVSRGKVEEQSAISEEQTKDYF